MLAYFGFVIDSVRALSLVASISYTDADWMYQIPTVLLTSMLAFFARWPGDKLSGWLGDSKRVVVVDCLSANGAVCSVLIG